MPNTIEHMVEPKRLLLAWQSMDDSASRTRFAVGELRAEPRPTFRYFSEAEFAAVNGRPIADIKALGYKQYPAFNPGVPVHDHGVIEAFMRRLPPRNRSDFAVYTRHFLLGSDRTVTDLQLLALTEAKLPSDGFSLVDPYDDIHARRDLITEVVGHRHYAATCDLEGAEGEPVRFVAEPDNLHDRNAIFVEARFQKIGYVNRLQCAAFKSWIVERRVHGVIERINGEPGRPRLYVFVRVAAARRQAIA